MNVTVSYQLLKGEGKGDGVANVVNLKGPWSLNKQSYIFVGVCVKVVLDAINFLLSGL